MSKAEKKAKGKSNKYVIIRKFIGEKSAEEVIIQMLKAHATAK